MSGSLSGFKATLEKPDNWPRANTQPMDDYDFPVPANRIAVQLKKFAVPIRREFALNEQCFRVSPALFDAAMSLNVQKFAVNRGGSANFSLL